MLPVFRVIYCRLKMRLSYAVTRGSGSPIPYNILKTPLKRLIHYLMARGDSSKVNIISGPMRNDSIRVILLSKIKYRSTPQIWYHVDEIWHYFGLMSHWEKLNINMAQSTWWTMVLIAFVGHVDCSRRMCPAWYWNSMYTFDLLHSTLDLPMTGHNCWHEWMNLCFISE